MSHCQSFRVTLELVREYRRSQRSALSWQRFKKYLKRYALLTPRVVRHLHPLRPVA